MSRPQLFCFMYAGGNASFFDVIEKDLPELEVVKPEYAGHGTRHKEPFYRRFDELFNICSAARFMSTKVRAFSFRRVMRRWRRESEKKYMGGRTNDI